MKRLILVDRQGLIQHKHLGAVAGEALEREIERPLRANGGQA